VRSFFRPLDCCYQLLKSINVNLIQSCIFCEFRNFKLLSFGEEAEEEEREATEVAQVIPANIH
jgi:hypothetical protein